MKFSFVCKVHGAPLDGFPRFKLTNLTELDEFYEIDLTQMNCPSNGLIPEISRKCDINDWEVWTDG